MRSAQTLKRSAQCSNPQHVSLQLAAHLRVVSRENCLAHSWHRVRQQLHTLGHGALIGHARALSPLRLPASLCVCHAHPTYLFACARPAHCYRRLPSLSWRLIGDNEPSSNTWRLRSLMLSTTPRAPVPPPSCRREQKELSNSTTPTPHTTHHQQSHKVSFQPPSAGPIRAGVSAQLRACPAVRCRLFLQNSCRRLLLSTQFAENVVTNRREELTCLQSVSVI